MTQLIHDKANIGSILLVEDDLALVQVLSEKLKNEGYAIVSVTTLQSAINMMRNQRFDCVVLDMVLETGFGADLIPALKTQWHNQPVPIIVTSGSLDMALVKKMAFDVKAVFVKPYDIVQLVKKVQQVTGSTG